MELAAPPLPLKDFCKDLEAFETPRWAIEALLSVELLTPSVVEPCNGTGAISRVLAEHGYRVKAIDIVDWREHLPPSQIKFVTDSVGDFLKSDIDLSGQTVFMNPPFSLACEFVDRARALGARKVVCFQRQAWRESAGRREWWSANKPARVWVCGARATCWRFDLLECQHIGGLEACPNFNLKNRGKPSGEGCSTCLGGVPTSHAFYVWEHGHPAAEICDAIYPEDTPKNINLKKETENV